MAAVSVPGDGKSASEILGVLLTRYRVQRSLSRAEVADRVGVTKSRIEDFEHGRDVPEPRAWARYCNMIAHGLRGYDAEWKAAIAEQSCPARAQEAVVKAHGFVANEPMEPQAEEHVLAEPLPSVADAKTFDAALTIARTLSGITQVDLAELIGMSASSIANWERGRGLPVTSSMDKLINVYPELTKWRDVARDMVAPPGFTQEMRSSVDPTITESPKRNNIAVLVSMALANSDTIANEPKTSKLRHDAYFTEVNPTAVQDDAQVIESLLQTYTAATHRRVAAVKALAKAKKALEDAQRVLTGAEHDAYAAAKALETAISGVDGSNDNSDGSAP